MITSRLSFLIPRSADALTAWPFIFVRPAARANRALIEHERVHYREQAWLTPIWFLRCWLSPEFRLQAEVRAYRRQMELGGITVDRAADLLCKNYGLDVPRERVVQLLTV